MGFDSEVLNSEVYSNAFTGLLQPDIQDDESDDARTIIETEPIGRTKSLGARTMRIVTGTAAEIYSLAIDAHEIRSCIQNLGVTKIDASVGVDNVAGLDEELSSKRYDRIYSISRLTKSRYHGQRKNSTGKWGQFDRKKVKIRFLLRSPFLIRTVKASGKPMNRKFCSYEKGEFLLVTVSINEPSFGMSNPSARSLCVVQYGLCKPSTTMQQRKSRRGFFYVTCSLKKE
jgi:hypothetical protein